MNPSFPSLSLPTLSSSSSSSSPRRTGSRRSNIRRTFSSSIPNRNRNRTFTRTRSVNAVLNTSSTLAAGDVISTLRQRHGQDDLTQDIEDLIRALSRWRISRSRLQRIARAARSLTSASSLQGNPFMIPPQSSRGLEDIFAALEATPSSTIDAKTLILDQLVPNRRYRIPVRPRWTIDVSDVANSDAESTTSDASLDGDIDLLSTFAGRTNPSASNDLVAAFANLSLNNESNATANGNNDNGSDISSISNLSDTTPIDLDPTDTLRIEHFRSVLLSMRHRNFLNQVRDRVALVSNVGAQTSSPPTREQLAARFANETARLLAENLRITNNVATQTSRGITGVNVVEGTVAGDAGVFLPPQPSSPPPFVLPPIQVLVSSALSRPRFGVVRTRRERRTVTWADADAAAER